MHFDMQFPVVSLEFSILFLFFKCYANKINYALTVFFFYLNVCELNFWWFEWHRRQTKSYSPVTVTTTVMQHNYRMN